MHDQAVAELTMRRISGVLATAVNMHDKALLVEKEVGTDPIYTMIAMGQSVAAIASSLGLSIFEMTYVLKRTDDHRKKYMNAKAFKLGEGSTVTLEKFTEVTKLDKEENFALKHHSSILDKSLKVLNASKDDKGGSNIVVNNTVVVRDRNDVPPLPEELQEIIEGEYVNTES